jgi:hypothetical protein
MSYLPPGYNAHKVFCFILCILESENLLQEIRWPHWIFITGALATMVPAYRTMENLKWWRSTCSQIMWFLCLGSRKLSLSAIFLLSIIHTERNELLPLPMLIKWKDIIKYWLSLWLIKTDCGDFQSCWMHHAASVLILGTSYISLVFHSPYENPNEHFLCHHLSLGLGILDGRYYHCLMLCFSYPLDKTSPHHMVTKSPNVTVITCTKIHSKFICSSIVWMSLE